MVCAFDDGTTFRVGFRQTGPRTAGVHARSERPEAGRASARLSAQPGWHSRGIGLTERLEGRAVADAVFERARAELARGSGPPAGLASVHLGTPTPFSVYLRRQERAAAQVGIPFRSVPLSPGADAAALKATLRALNDDPGIHGILLEHPLPAELDFRGASATLTPAKDVDGIGPVNLGRLVAHRPGPVPAVARAAIEIARYYRIGLAGRRVAVVGRSESVGVPLSLLLLGRGEGGDATVTVAHSRTPDLAGALAGNEVIFSCAGRPGLLHRGNVPKGARVIDIGLTMVPDPTRTGGLRGAGDANADSLDGWAGALTPVPGGVGPVSVACLMLAVAEARARLLAPEGPW